MNQNTCLKIRKLEGTIPPPAPLCTPSFKTFTMIFPSKLEKKYELNKKNN